MKINKKFIMILILVLAVTIGVAEIGTVKQKGEYTNLKVLPKGIRPKALQKIMVDEFQDGLGVGCNYCHAQEKGSLHLDYASDQKSEKEIARSMMRMTMEINNKYFGVENPLIGDSILSISCSSCHHGTPHPDRTD